MADPLDYAALITSWTVHLRAERKSPQTIASYVAGAQGFLRFCERESIDPILDRRTAASYVADLLEAGAAASTARQRQLAVRRFSHWLAEEGEIEQDALLGIKPVKLDELVVEPLSDDQIRAMLKACNGKRFVDRRDEAMLRVLFECALRIGELLALDVDDVDIANGSAIIRRGKGGKGRSVPFGPQTARSIDRWLRMRATHSQAGECPALWLARRRDRLGYAGARKSLIARAEAAGISDFHPHLSRHSAATRWLAAGGSEGGLLAIAGWSNRTMIDRYTRYTKSQRAAEESRRLNLGDL